MKLKSDAHDSLLLLFQRDGVPPKMIMDGSKEQTLGRFKKKYKSAFVAFNSAKCFHIINTTYNDLL